MAGHVYLVQGDLTKLFCDAWLLPCDAAGHTMDHWHADRTFGVPRAWGDDVKRGHGFDHGRTHPVDVQGERRPVPWMTHTGGVHESDAWYVEGVRQFVTRAAEAIAEGKSRRLTRRVRPLLALPLVGTGAGGAALRPGGILTALLGELYDLAAAHDVDLVLVLKKPADYAAAVRARAQLGGERAVWPEQLEASLQEQATRLAALAVRGQLVLFLGAGIGVGSGLPLWRELLADLAKLAQVPGYDAPPDAQAKEAFESLYPLDQAALIERELAAREREVGSEIAKMFRSHVRPSLMHFLLAGLPVSEAVTTNYDRLYEEAVVSSKGAESLRVLPYDPGGSGGAWLLKLHGCVEHPRDIVLTRRDYLRYAKHRGALQGIVQAMLVTRHLLFVGFSATDENFHQIVDDVRSALGTSAEGGRTFGTCLGFEESRLMEGLWGGELEWIWLQPAGRARGEASWLIEVFADFMTDAAAGPRYLLDPRYEAWLSENEKALRDRLMALVAEEDKEMNALPSWPLIADLLARLGLPGRDA